MQSFLFLQPGLSDILMVLLLVLLPLAVWVWALVEVIKSEFKRDSNKLIWLLLVVLGSLPGAILYFLIGRNQRLAPSR